MVAFGVDEEAHLRVEVAGGLAYWADFCRPVSEGLRMMEGEAQSVQMGMKLTVRIARPGGLHLSHATVVASDCWGSGRSDLIGIFTVWSFSCTYLVLMLTKIVSGLIPPYELEKGTRASSSRISHDSILAFSPSP